jgi:hypothetical protein
MKLDRRALLRGVGGAAIALPLLEAMLPTQRAAADPPAMPKRVVFFMSFNGAVMDRYTCKVNPTNDSDFVLSDILAPLAPIKQHCLVLEGVAMKSSYDPEQRASAHQGGAASCLTGTWAGPGNMDGGENKKAGWAVSESIDHALGKQLGTSTKFPAYYFGVIPTAPDLVTRVFYQGKDAPISPNANPYQVNAKLFSQLGADVSAWQKRLQEREAVLDFVIDEIRDLRCKLGTADRMRLDQHLEQVEEIEKRLYLVAGKNPKCVPVAPRKTTDHYDFDQIPALGRLQMDQIAMALTCDLTRVAGLQWISPVNGAVYSWLGHQTEHHELSHANTPKANDQLVQINAWYADQLVYLVQKLKSIPEGNGTLLDNTLIVWAEECGNPWTHDRIDVPWVLAGNLGGYFKTGRYLRFAHEPHNRLLLSIFEAMGAPRASFGAAQYCQGGPLPGLKA